MQCSPRSTRMPVPEPGKDYGQRVWQQIAPAPAGEASAVVGLLSGGTENSGGSDRVAGPP